MIWYLHLTWVTFQWQAPEFHASKLENTHLSLVNYEHNIPKAWEMKRWTIQHSVSGPKQNMTSTLTTWLEKGLSVQKLNYSNVRMLINLITTGKWFYSVIHYYLLVIFFIFFNSLVVLGVKPRTLYMLSMHSHWATSAAFLVILICISTQHKRLFLKWILTMTYTQ